MLYIFLNLFLKRIDDKLKSLKTFVMNLISDETKQNFLFIQLFPIDIYEKLYHVIRHFNIKNFKYNFNECDFVG